MISQTFRARFVFALLASGAVLMPLSAVQGQSLNDGMKDLESAYRRHYKLAAQLMRGTATADANDKSHVAALDVEAKYLTYRVYLDKLEIREEKPGGNTRPTMARAFRDFIDDLEYLQKGKPGTQAAADLFRDRLRVHALEVIQFEKAKPIHKIFNARILADTAKLGQPQIADTLIEVLKDDKQNDGVHFYALRGLKNLLALVQPMQLPPVLTKPQQEKCAGAILDYLEHKQAPPKLAPKDEIDGYRVLRREAIRALAQIHTPTLSEKVRPALMLARVAGADGSIQPEPRIDERVEAAIGLAYMVSAQDTLYQPDYAANQIGRCLSAFGKAFNEEKPKKEAGVEFTRPWKIDSFRLTEALKALKADSKSAYVASVVERGTRLLSDVMRGDQPKSEDVTWFESPEGDPPAKELFKGVADSAVKPAKPEEAAPEK